MKVSWDYSSQYMERQKKIHGSKPPIRYILPSTVSPTFAGYQTSVTSHENHAESQDFENSFP
jgi:hypothetical protein